MKLLRKENIPLAFLILLAAFWSYFYQSHTWLNEEGKVTPEWLLLIDGLLVLPILCFVFISDKKQALLKASVYCCLIILLGSYVIPESSKVVWHYFELGRYAVLFAFLLFELVAISTVIFAIKTALTNKRDPELAIVQAVEKWVSSKSIQKLICFETRVWTYLLFSKRIKREAFEGEQHFSCHNKDGTQSNLLGFILIIAFEVPVAHMLLHFIWSPTAATVISVLTLVSLVFFIAEYKAIAIRPVSLSLDRLIIRYGVWNPVEVNYAEIVSVVKNSNEVRRQTGVRRFNLSGTPNVKIQMANGELIYLGMDTPETFISELQSRTTFS